MDDKALRLNGGGLKCDNPDCDWIDMSIPMKDYKKWLNAPCPKCGCNLLTKQDYKMVKVLNGLVRVVNFIYFFIPKKWLKKKLEKKYGSFDENDMAQMTFSFDGSGEPHVGPIVKVDKNDIPR